jgi:hypothetical protein
LSDCAAEIVVAAIANVSATAASFKYLQTEFIVFAPGGRVLLSPATMPEHLAQSSQNRPWLTHEVFMKVS